MKTAGEASPRGCPECRSCPIRQHTEWCVLSPDQLKLVENVRRSRPYVPGDVLYHEGDESHGMYCIQAGMVGLRKTDADGASVLLRLAYPGETLGYRSLLAGDAHGNTAEVLKPSTICFIDKQPIMHILASSPNFGLRFLKRAASDLGRADERILQGLTMTVRSRFAHLLLILKDRYGTHVDGGAVCLDLPLSRHDLAAMVGARPETMSRTIKQMQAEGIALFQGRRVVIPTVQALLRELSDDDAG